MITGMSRLRPFHLLLLAGVATILATSCSTRTARPIVPPTECTTLEDQQTGVDFLLELSGLPEGERILPAVPETAFRDAYFSILQGREEDLDQARWAWHAFADGEVVTEDLRPAPLEFFTAMDEEAVWEARGSLGVPGIALTTVSLRAMPTARPLLAPADGRGRGFPFDQLQNSLAAANEPLWLSHRSRSGAWTYVLTSYASGWVPSRTVAAIAAEHAIAWPTLPLAAATTEGRPVRDRDGTFLFETRVGMVLPLLECAQNHCSVLVASSKDSAGLAQFTVADIPRTAVDPAPLAPTAENFSRLVAELVGRPYGWGGLYSNRDCSAALRDLFMGFGLWLPRNSSQQARVGEVVDLKGLGEEEKARVVLDRAQPFRTLLYKPGHIALYVGERDGRPVVFHSVWRLKTGLGENRRHIGRAVLSVLRPAGEMGACGPGSTLLANLESMNVVRG